MMVLVDTSVWIEHFRAREAVLAELLNEGSVLAHRIRSWVKSRAAT